MPCLVLTGYPSAGKTFVAETIGKLALELPEIDSVVHIHEGTACQGLTVEQSYADSLAEKKTRGALKATFDKAVAKGNKKTLIIFDSLNYIKGYRYELHCISKAAGERHGIVWVWTDSAQCHKWNETRQTNRYSRELLDALVSRYEPPDDRNRWDKPLFRIETGVATSAARSLENSVYDMHKLSSVLGSTKVESSTEQMAAPKPKKSAFKRKVKPKAATDTDTIAAGSTAGGNIEQSNEEKEKKSTSVESQCRDMLKAFLSNTVQPLKEGFSTMQQVAASANTMYNIDTVTQRICASITSESSVVTFSSNGDTMPWKSKMIRTQAFELRKQFLAWMRQHPPDDATEKGVAQTFLAYIQEADGR